MTDKSSHWDPTIIKPEVWIDFHHTISTKCGACPGEDVTKLCAGELQEGARETLEMLKNMGVKVVIYTGYGNFIGDTERATHEVEDWLTDHGLSELVYDVRTDKPTWFLMIGDRTLHHRNWTETRQEVERRFREDLVKGQGVT